MRATPPEQVARDLELGLRGRAAARRRARAARRPGARDGGAHRAHDGLLAARDRAALARDPRHARGRHRLPRGPARRGRPARRVRRPPRGGRAGATGRCSSTAPYESTVELAGRGLLLVPVAFAWPELWAMIDPPWQPAVVYAPRGVATLWEPAERAPDALADLLGRRRARDPRRAPRRDHAGARPRHAASPAGVSEHLAVLRRAGLVARPPRGPRASATRARRPATRSWPPRATDESRRPPSSNRHQHSFHPGGAQCRGGSPRTSGSTARLRRPRSTTARSSRTRGSSAIVRAGERSRPSSSS